MQNYTIKTFLIHFKPCCKGPWNILEIKYAMKKSQKSKCLTVTPTKTSHDEIPWPYLFLCNPPFSSSGLKIRDHLRIQQGEKTSGTRIGILCEAKLTRISAVLKLRVSFLKVFKKEYHTCVSLLGRGFMTWDIGGVSVLAN
jgi:hypothetical protein